jgi:hypothetical protein
MALEDSTNPMQGVSGPGKYAKRTDLSYQSQSYGDGVAYDAAKSGAKLATAPKSPMLSQAPQVPTPQAPVTGLFEPTQRPDEPATHGVDIGKGGGSNVLAMRQPDDNNFRAALSQYKPVLNFIADNPNTSPETRQAIADLWDNL